MSEKKFFSWNTWLSAYGFDLRYLVESPVGSMCCACSKAL